MDNLTFPDTALEPASTPRTRKARRVVIAGALVLVVVLGASAWWFSHPLRSLGPALSGPGQAVDAYLRALAGGDFRVALDHTVYGDNDAAWRYHVEEEFTLGGGPAPVLDHAITRIDENPDPTFDSRPSYLVTAELTLPDGSTTDHTFVVDRDPDEGIGPLLADAASGYVLVESLHTRLEIEAPESLDALTIDGVEAPRTEDSVVVLLTPGVHSMVMPELGKYLGYRSWETDTSGEVEIVVDPDGGVAARTPGDGILSEVKPADEAFMARLSVEFGATDALQDAVSADIDAHFGECTTRMLRDADACDFLSATVETDAGLASLQFADVATAEMTVLPDLRVVVEGSPEDFRTRFEQWAHGTLAVTGEARIAGEGTATFDDEIPVRIDYPGLTVTPDDYSLGWNCHANVNGECQ